MRGRASISPDAASENPRGAAPLFAALSDSTRLQLVAQLANQGPQSISDLAEDTTISRQAVSKHLRVLEDAGIAASRREGRQRIFKLQPERLTAVHRYLDRIDRQWNDAITRLQGHVEKEQEP